VKVLERHVIIHSFHSQVHRTLDQLDFDVETVVAFDAHLDISLPPKEVLALIPENIRLAANRVCAHTLIRRVFGELPIFRKVYGLPEEPARDMYLVAPKCGLRAHIFEVAKIELPRVRINGSISSNEFRRLKKGLLEHISLVLGIKVFTSPPKDLGKLIKIVKNAKDALVDLDIDYLTEMQTECYTALKGAKLGELGRMQQVLRFFRKIKPSIVTISEVKVEAIKDPKSNFSMFVNSLEAMGYEIKYQNVFASEKQAEKILRIYQELCEYVWKPIMNRNIAQSYLPNYRDNRTQDLIEATKKYFSSNFHERYLHCQKNE
jgi:hypothetical protein